MSVIPFREHSPLIDGSSFIAPDAWVIGQVSIAANVSMFFGAVARGDILPISVGAGSNIQEHAMLHTSNGLTPCIVGSEVTVGHRAIIHGATVMDRCIIGMGSTLLDGAVIGEDCIVGAHALVTMNTKMPAGHLILGSPAKAVRKLSAEELSSLRFSARNYMELGRYYRANIPQPA